MSDHRADAVAAALIAFEAGQLLVSLHRSGAASDQIAAADVTSDRLIGQLLSERFPDDAVLSEEAADRPERHSHRRVWIVDPLDGTREYRELNRDDWAVHVALFDDGELCAGAVAIPQRSMLFSSAAPFPRAPREDGPLRLAVSRTRPPAEAQTLRDRLGASLVPMGSAGVKAMAVVRGEVDGYVHAGGQYEWDSAAPVSVARANGLHTSRIDGSDLHWNQQNPWQPDVLICRPECASVILTALSKADAK